MAFLTSLDVSASALTAQRLRMDVISQNIANANTTRTEEGGEATPYRRKVVVFQPQEKEPFSAFLSAEKSQFSGAGVKVTQIEEDPSPFKLMYEPGHPDADEDGYVRLPNVDIVKEMTDMISATRSYEANVTAINAAKSMALKALEISK
ncbi:MAG: flagellar basal body rod protein FlgC [Clostridia bacterium]|jgi:flagellar basal-body rod protein FlgC